jgi:nucleoside-triphosphatase THEP1
LDLSQNEIGQGIIALAEGLAENKKLTYLNLERTRQKKQAALALAQAVSKSAVRKLNIAYNEIDENTIQTLKQQLPHVELIIGAQFSKNVLWGYRGR